MKRKRSASQGYDEKELEIRSFTGWKEIGFGPLGAASTKQYCLRNLRSCAIPRACDRESSTADRALWANSSITLGIMCTNAVVNE